MVVLSFEAGRSRELTSFSWVEEQRFRHVAIPRQPSSAASPYHDRLGGRLNNGKMVYNWDNFETICYQMYIEDKKSLEEIMEYMKVHHKFSPRSVSILYDNLELYPPP